MDKCGICDKPAVQLFETGKEGVYACFKCSPLVPEVTMEDDVTIEEPSDPLDVSETFQKNTQLQNHLRNHRAERRFVCTYCNKAFSQSNNLRAHLRIHTNERPYKCNECGKAFTQVTNLNNHVRLHTGERPFVCPEPGCNKAYAQVTNLNQHRKRHLGGRAVESTYDCTICGQQFEQRNHMYTHRRSAHYGARSPARAPARHACKLCERRFSTERQLVAHVAQHVPDQRGHEDDTEGTFLCVFSSCGARLSSPREHTEHLLRAHQLRVHAARPAQPATESVPQQPPKRGRPPKIIKVESMDDFKDSIFNDVKIIKEESQFLPKLKVQSLFQ
ncbi:gastrula zinc finger protein XlCGF7.1-like isoform X2 [Leguminivora glycinivorella]|uniref:gastrula zinc finger protein XlCGF7.1-like isoform X2 n=1 Tax=Leguminivora glycinivorella TaxID=1035111 RepID=UPI00200BC398|nr:gastrula zinc finger protein XlCGF7.1-like isoform X2 [Leguminivora glycinivorella]